MVNVCQDNLQELVGDDRTAIGKPKQRVVGEDSSHSHSPGMENSFMAEGTEGL